MVTNKQSKKCLEFTSPPSEGQRSYAFKKFPKGWVKVLTCAFTFLSFTVLINAQPRQIIDFNKGWKFFLGNDTAARLTEYNDSKWRSLSVPHDWSIESDFIKDAPATNQGGSLPGGIAWYRKAFNVPLADSHKVYTICFDGIYKKSEVWINGNYLGKRPNGYVNFNYYLSQFLHFGKPNIIAVKVDNSQQPDSRWYTGSGIYRDVKLQITEPTHIRDNGLVIVPTVYSDTFATVSLTTEIYVLNQGYETLRIEHQVLDPQGNRVSNLDKPVKPVYRADYTMHKYYDEYSLKKTMKWSPEKPVLYTLVTRIYRNNKLVDEISSRFGFRTIKFDNKKGFLLNGKPYLIKGVCMHHDLGALGAAFNKEAARRQLRILKEMGCNAIRFSHNPPASAMLDLCDEMGFLVIDEAFDIWKKKKNKYDYHQYFDEWGIKDAQAMVLRDRNHPSVIMWSIGNEQREQFDSSGTTIVKKLVDAIKEVDATRPVTTALTETFPEKNFITKANALDVLGFNYKLYDYEALPKRFPGQKFIATETASALETRGVYNFPSDSIRIWPPDYKVQDTFANGNKDYTAAAYDNTHAYWGATHEKSWLAVKRNAHMAGLFVWSGFDYLGEPLPYPKFPARSSYYGIVDLAGFPKDVYYMYQSEWSQKNVLHLFPHWSWNKGDTVDVWTYYNNADEVELFVNNKSVGTRMKTDSTLHVMWRVPFQPGVLKAISRKNGKTVLTKEIRTAGTPYRIELKADKLILKATGKDLSFVTVRILDKAGNIVPDADHLIEFLLKGYGTINGTDNGYQADTISLKSTKRQTWKGMALAIVQSGEKKGNITLMAAAKGLKSASLVIKTTD
jgi:beta-galactosidase